MKQTIKIDSEGDIDISNNTIAVVSIEAAIPTYVQTVVQSAVGNIKGHPLWGASLVSNTNAPINTQQLIATLKKEIEIGGFFKVNSSDIKTELNQGLITISITKAQRVK